MPVAPLVVLTVLSAASCQAQGEPEALRVAMSGALAADPHLRLTPLSPASAADSAHGAALVVKMRGSLGKYRDAAVAEADVKQPIYHFTNWRWALEAMFRFEPEKPTSLLHRETEGGRLELVGVMYTAPARTSLARLDRRIPTGLARWHQHVNWCVPPRGARERWLETEGGQPVFGPTSPVATAEACAAVGGRFFPRVCGWMVHVQAFASDDPRVIWGGESHVHAHDH